jgi:hypothetical protein
MIQVSAIRAIGAGALACALLLAGPASADHPATLTRSVVVHARPDAVWAVIGPFCAIGQWHPAIGSCTTDDAVNPTRTLLTRDGAATFVELEVARNDVGHRYSYSFTSSPIPVTRYLSTFSVRASGKDSSVVTWRGEFKPEDGQTAAATAALAGIYESGLAAIQERFAAP